MFGDQKKHLARLEKELLKEEPQTATPVWEQEDWEPEAPAYFHPPESLREEAPPRKKKMSRLTKLTVTALLLLAGIVLVLLYWLVRFFL